MRTGPTASTTAPRRPRGGGPGYFEGAGDVAMWFKVPAPIYELNRQASPAGARALETRGAKRLRHPHRRVPTDDAMTASDLRELRQRLELSQTALAERLGLSGAMVSFMEQGKRLIPPETAARLQTLAGTAGLNNGAPSSAH